MARARSSKLSEFSAIAELERIFDGRASRRASAKPSASRSGFREHTAIELAIGDDAAVLRSRERLVWTIDSAVEHVHFERAWLTLEDLGFRSFQAAASDVSAMGGKPWCALSSVIVPKNFSANDLKRIARGQRAAARALGCRVVGGNLARGAELSLTTALLGITARPLLRSGAKAGDELWLCGEVGLAAAGLRLLQRGSVPKTSAARRALNAFRRPQAELAFGVALAGRAHAAIDISDGLCGDAAHIAEASRVKIIIETPRLERALSAELRTLAPTLGVSALELALYGGEDYALLAAGPARSRPRGAQVIGYVAAGEKVWLSPSSPSRGSAREPQKLVRARRGFEHF
ncbi:MAG TPA: thiamine-phosphate kinase [Polyangiaceae bacterium]|jgi:thiamine-monophosphate kinase|nr:thiamine-phosphate kinase [Polyangiaceae bacterium]